MNIVVTGGAGFIGANFVYYMLENRPEDKIICYDKLTYAGNLATLAEAQKNQQFKFIKGDIADREAVYKMFEEEKLDVIVNFAAESHVDRSIENPEIFLQTNVIGTSVLMDACRKYGIKRYHQVSTDEVYGDLPLDRPDLFFTEETPPVFCFQGFRRFAGNGLPSHLRPARDYFPLLQQLWAFPFPREAHSPHDHQRHAR